MKFIELVPDKPGRASQYLGVGAPLPMATLTNTAGVGVQPVRRARSNKVTEDRP
jgi:hypothetical protein